MNKEDYVPNHWHISENTKRKYIPIIREYLNKLEHLTTIEIEQMPNEQFELDLYHSELAPYTLKKLLEEEFNYKEISSDNNGWELDLWINMERIDGKCFDSTCEKLTIQACGQTFNLILVPSEMQ